MQSNMKLYQKFATFIYFQKKEKWPSLTVEITEFSMKIQSKCYILLFHRDKEWNNSKRINIIYII